jgi:hypothetical protein
MINKGGKRRIPPAGIPFNELGVMRNRTRKRRPDIADQRRRYRDVLRQLAERSKQKGS